MQDARPDLVGVLQWNPGLSRKQAKVLGQKDRPQKSQKDASLSAIAGSGVAGGQERQHGILDTRPRNELI